MEKYFARKKNFSQILFDKVPRSYWPRILTGIQFWHFTQKLIDSIYNGSRNKRKNLLQEKKPMLNFVP